VNGLKAQGSKLKGCEAGKMGCWEAMKRGSCKDRDLEDEKVKEGIEDGKSGG